MRAPLSIIIPTLEAGKHLLHTLDALGEGLAAGLIRELIISDGGSGDNTSLIADEAGATFITGPRGRGGQLRRGANAAQGQWLLFLHADTKLDHGWSQALQDHISNHPDHAGYFKLVFDDPRLSARWTAGWANLRARAFNLPYGDQGLLISRKLYEQVGGFQDIPLMEDVAIARVLGKRLKPLPAKAITSGQKYSQKGYFRRGARNLSLLLRYLLGADPKHLASVYDKS